MNEAATLHGASEPPLQANTAFPWLVAAAAILVLAAWLLGIFRREHNYDELEHAHVVWMMGEGLRPFHDFFECHPPFVWYLLAPLARGAESAAGLLLELRLATALANGLVLVLVAANLRLGRADVPLAWTWAGVLLVVASRPNLDYLIDFRPDACPTALLLAAILLLRMQRPRPVIGRYALFALLGTTSVLASPKLLVLLGLFAGLDLLSLRREARGTIVQAVVSLLAGGIGAVALGAGFLSMAGVSPKLAWSLTIPYHALLAKNAGFDHGLAESLTAQKFLLSVVVGGMICWLYLALSRQIKASTFEVSVAAFLLLQTALVPFPYRQYFAPWFLLGATFIPCWPLLLARFVPKVTRMIVAVTLLLATSAAGLSTLDLSYAEGARNAEEYWSIVTARLPRDARVVAAVPLHPVIARDACYGWVRSGDPLGRYETEEIMRDLDLPGISERFESAWYERELEAAAPELIATGVSGDDRLASRYARAVAAYTRRHAAEYDVVQHETKTLFVRKPAGAGPPAE